MIFGYYSEWMKFLFFIERSVLYDCVHDLKENACILLVIVPKF